MKLRCSATEIDQYRDYLADVIDLETLLSRLRKESPPSVPMFAGRAWHKLMETTPPCHNGCLVSDDFTFFIDADLSVELPPIKELKGVKEYNTLGVDVTLVGMVDGMNGNNGIDYKLTARPNPERLVDAYQWRIYVVLFNLFRFDYIICHADKTDKQEITIKAIDRLPLYRYPNIEKDVSDMVTQFTMFILTNLPERITE
jgi:hypothetical protein